MPERTDVKQRRHCATWWMDYRYSLGEAVERARLNVRHLVVIQGQAGQLAQAPKGPLSESRFLCLPYANKWSFFKLYNFRNSLKGLSHEK